LTGCEIVQRVQTLHDVLVISCDGKGIVMRPDALRARASIQPGSAPTSTACSTRIGADAPWMTGNRPRSVDGHARTFSRSADVHGPHTVEAIRAF
jgi:hypothetical protein